MTLRIDYHIIQYASDLERAERLRALKPEDGWVLLLGRFHRYAQSGTVYAELLVRLPNWVEWGEYSLKKDL